MNQIELNLREVYTYETEEVKNKPGTWSSTRVNVYQTMPDGSKKKLGDYLRNYSMLDTFYPFIGVDGNHYALISESYEEIKVISLPDMKTVAVGDDRFCPVEFYVPDKGDYVNDHRYGKPEYNAEMCGYNGQHGFVAGCYWGDDSSWKVAYIDLSKIAEGKIDIQHRFGYLEMGWKTLKDTIDMSHFIRGYKSSGKEYNDNRVLLASSITGSLAPMDMDAFHRNMSTVRDMREKLVKDMIDGKFALLSHEEKDALQDVIMEFGNTDIQNLIQHDGRFWWAFSGFDKWDFLKPYKEQFKIKEFRKEDDDE